MSASPEFPCPSDEELRSALGHEPDAKLETHLSECASCRERLDALAEFGETATLLADFDRWSAPSAELDSALFQLVSEGRPSVALAPTPVPREEILAQLAPCDEPGALGRLDEHLVVHEVLGQGGMGIVLRARDTALDREVAVKLLKPSFREFPDLIERFREEARAVAALEHENVIPIHQVGVLGNGLPYFVMPLAKGPTLARRLRDHGRPAFPDSLDIAIRAGRALAAAHAAGIIHRDLKPGNLLLGASSDPGGVWLSDFGLASRDEKESAQANSGRGGTPGYLAPEIIAGEKASPRSDLYALGCLFADLAGDDAPGWFLELAEELRAPDPQARPESATDVVRRLERRVEARKSSQVQRRMFARGLAVAGLILLVGAVVFALDSSGRTSLVNDTLRALGEDEFTIEGRFGTYSSLVGAIESTNDGDRVLIHRTEPISLSPTGLRRRSLAVAVDPRLGKRAVLEMSPSQIGPAGLLWVQAGDLHLSGIEIRHASEKSDTNRRIPPLIRIREGNLTVENCRFTRSGLRPDSESPLFLVSDCAELDIRDSEFETDHGTCLQWRIQGELIDTNVRIADSQFRGREWLDIAVAPGFEVPLTRLDVTAIRCDMETPESSAAMFRRTSQTIDLLLKTIDCRIATSEAGLISFESGNEAQLRRRITIRDEGSLFSPAPGGPEAAREIWMNYWGDAAFDEASRWVDSIDFSAPRDSH